jgi:hypothetical protein
MNGTAVAGDPTKGSMYLKHSDMLIGGTPEDPTALPADVAEQCTDNGHLEVFHSDYLRGGVNLDNFRDSVSVDLSSLYQQASTNTPPDSNPSEFTYLRKLFESVWSALRYKQWWAGKEDYRYGAVSNGRKCGSNTWFKDGEMFLFIDEATNVKMTVATAAKRTETIELRGNQRYQVVVHESSTCIYVVESEYKAPPGGRHSDYSCEETCPCPATP